jgi:hypothetical protein
MSRGVRAPVNVIKFFNFFGVHKFSVECVNFYAVVLKQLDSLVPTLSSGCTTYLPHPWAYNGGKEVFSVGAPFMKRSCERDHRTDFADLSSRNIPKIYAATEGSKTTHGENLAEN